jgi:galactokinase/mevalonate kinase-like predicted kinase
MHSYNIYYDLTTYRLRYQGHIINLAVNSFIYVTNSEALEENEQPTI